MTQSEDKKYSIIEQGLSEQLAEKINNLLEGFFREHKCKANPVIFFAPTTAGQPITAAGVQFQCVTDERIAQIKRERTPQIITTPINGKLVN